MIVHLREYIDFSDIDTDETVEDSPLTNEEFVKFLRTNNIYRRFMDNLYKAVKEKKWGYGRYWYSIETFCDDMNARRYIARSFIWNESPEGNDFWKYYNNEWKEQLPIN